MKILIKLLLDGQLLNFIDHRIKKLLQSKGLIDKFAISDYELLCSIEKKSDDEDLTSNCIVFVIPDFSASSGGHATIFRIISYLESKGCRTAVVLFNNTSFFNTNYLRYKIGLHYKSIQSQLFLNYKDFESSEIYKTSHVVATSWPTSYYVRSLEIPTWLKHYLVQDYEPHFYARSAEYLLAESTYCFNLNFICASKWLELEIKKKNTSARTQLFQLGYNPSIYIDKKLHRKKQVAVYIRPATARRGFLLVKLALTKFNKEFPDYKIVFFGQHIDFPMGFVYDSIGVLSAENMCVLYNESSIGLSISLTNVSLIPLEMMACGLPVVELNHDSVSERFTHEQNILLAEPNCDSIFEQLKLYASSEIQRESIADQAKLLVKHAAWDNCLEEFPTFFGAKNI